MHSKRVIVALLVLPLLYLYIMELPGAYFALLVSAASVFALYEFYSMFPVKGILRHAGMALGLAVLFAAYKGRGGGFEIVLFSFAFLSVLRLFSERTPASSLRDVSTVLFGLLYVPGLLSFQIGLRDMGAEWIIFLYASIWAADAAAYYAGKNLGKRRLYAEVSPKKTVAGAVGSVFGGGFGAAVMNALVMNSVPYGKAVILGLLIGAVTVVGDLVESMLKRDAGVKDSGSLIPGHGGMLDKLDGALFAGPALFLVLSYGFV